MRKLSKSLIATIVLLCGVHILNAQVKFAVKYEHYDDVQDTVKVYLTSDVYYSKMFSITSTAQVTLKIPTGMLPDIQNINLNQGVAKLIRLYENGNWVPNSRVDNPTSQPGFDFISFGLMSMGTREIEYFEGQEIPLFSFPFNGDCLGLIELIDNDNDPFINNGKTSPNNAITILGARGNAYSGVYDVGRANCDDYDNDNVPNKKDKCPKSKPNAVVNDEGCSRDN